MFSISSLAGDNSERSRALPSPAQGVSHAEDPQWFHVTQPAWQSLTSREHICCVCFSGHGEGTQYVTEVKVAPKTAYPLTPRTVSSGRKPVWLDTICPSSARSSCCPSPGCRWFQEEDRGSVDPITITPLLFQLASPISQGPRAAAEQQQGPRSPHPGSAQESFSLWSSGFAV